MAKKPKEVDRFKMEQYGIDIPIKLDTENSEFIAEYGGEKHRDRTLNGLRDALRKFVRMSLEITWHPVILVNRLEDRHGNRSWQQVGFFSERFYVAWVNGTRKKVDWSGMHDVPFTEEERRQRMQNFYLSSLAFDSLPILQPLTSKHDEVFLLPYSDATWQAMQTLQDKIGELRKGLDRLLSSNAGLLQLQKFNLALPAGPTEETT